MRTLHVAEDIVPIGEFKTHASELLRRLATSRRPLVITQNGRPAAVVLTPEEFDSLGYPLKQAQTCRYPAASLRAGRAPDP
jgi:prevent-host-death family protein